MGGGARTAMGQRRRGVWGIRPNHLGPPPPPWGLGENSRPNHNVPTPPWGLGGGRQQIGMGTHQNTIPK